MSRNLTAGVITELNAAEVQPFLLFQGEFNSGTIRAWSGIGNLSWNSQTWTGTGTLLTISAVQENSDTSANGITASLSGIPASLISLALSECSQGDLGYVYLGFIKNNAIVSDPVLLFEGRLDIPAIEENGETAVVSISYESRLIDLDRPRESRYTNEDQQRAFPGDLGMEFVADLQDKNLVWGRATKQAEPTTTVNDDSNYSS